MRLRGRQVNRWAFTLVEVLIAVGIFSMVIAAIYACWSAVQRSTVVGMEAAAKVQRSRMAMRCIEDALTYARMSGGSPANVARYAFEGESGDDARLSFVAVLPDSFPRSGKPGFQGKPLRRVEFCLVAGENSRRQLVLRQRPLLEDFDEDEENYPLVLARDVEEMTVEFWHPQDQDWMDEWSETNQIAPLVRVTLATAARKGNREVRDENTVLVSPACMIVQAAFQRGVPPQPAPGNPRAVPVPPPPAANPGNP